MSQVIVIEEVKYGTNAGQGLTASGEGGYDIWIRHKDNYYEAIGDRVEIRYLPHE